MPHLQVKYLPVAEIKRYARNPKQHPDTQIRKLANIIREFGFTVPLLIDDHGLIAGHGRLAAAELLGMTELPTIYYPGLTESQRRAYVIADNKISELGAWDEALLIEELESIKMDGGNLSLTGFSDNELYDLLDVGPNTSRGPGAIPNAQAQAPSEFPAFDENIKVDYRCPKCSHEWGGNPKP